MANNFIFEVHWNRREEQNRSSESFHVVHLLTAVNFEIPIRRIDKSNDLQKLNSCIKWRVRCALNEGIYTQCTQLSTFENSVLALP